MSTLKEEYMEMGCHEDEDSQEGVSTKNMPDLFKDDKIIETSIVKCEPQQVQLGQSSRSKKLSRLYLGHFWTKI